MSSLIVFMLQYGFPSRSYSPTRDLQASPYGHLVQSACEMSVGEMECFRDVGRLLAGGEDRVYATAQAAGEAIPGITAWTELEWW